MCTHHLLLEDLLSLGTHSIGRLYCFLTYISEKSHEMESIKCMFHNDWMKEWGKKIFSVVPLLVSCLTMIIQMIVGRK